MSGLDAFWEMIDQQIKLLEKAQTADEVIAILPNVLGEVDFPASGADGFFMGSGGDQSVREALNEAGWRTTWSEASYYYVIQAPNGDKITYIEGDIYKGDTASKND